MEITPVNTSYLEVHQTKQDFPDRRQVVEQQKIEAQKAAEALQAAQVAEQARIAQAAQTGVTRAVALSGDAMSNIFARESGGRLDAVNAGGCLGLGQACPGSKLIAACPNYATDYACQVNFFTNYAVSRYGSWDGAWAFWQGHGWW